MKRVLAIILVAIMCLASLPIVFVSANGTASGELANLFTTTAKGGVGIINAEANASGHGSNKTYWCTEPIAVTTADTLYFLGESTIGYHVTLYGKDGVGLNTNVKPAALTVVEKVGEFGGVVFNIYSYTPAENVGYVRISQRATTYARGCVLLTKNQPFDLAAFKTWIQAAPGQTQTAVQ